MGKSNSKQTESESTTAATSKTETDASTTETDSEKEEVEPPPPRSWEEFAQQTTLHGAGEIAVAKGWRKKLMWIGVVCMGLALMLFLVIETTIEFATQPSSSEILNWEPPYFPPILFCPHDWIDDNKLLQYGLEPDHRYFLESLLGYRRKEDSAGWDNIDGARSIELRASLKAAMAAHRMNLEEMMMAVANPIEEHVLQGYDQRYFERVEAKVIMQVLPIAFCYKIIPQHNLSEIESHYNIFFFEIKSKYDRTDTEKYDEPTTEMMFFGGQADSINPVGPTMFETARDYRVQVESFAVQKKSTVTGPCIYDWSVREQTSCQLHCLVRDICRSGCQIFYPPSFTQGRDSQFYQYTSIDTICSHLDTHEEHCTERLFREKHGDRCYGACLDPCERVAFTSSSFSLPGNVLNLSETRTPVTVSFLHALQSTKIREFAAYSWESYVSNLGGTVSLFFGASILSVLHAFSYCITWYCYDKKQISIARLRDQVQAFDRRKY